MKPLCEWCDKEEYHIGILTKENKEELICKTCFRKFTEDNRNKITESGSMPGGKSEKNTDTTS